MWATPIKRPLIEHWIPSASLCRNLFVCKLLRARWVGTLDVCKCRRLLFIANGLMVGRWYRSDGLTIDHSAREIDLIDFHWSIQVKSNHLIPIELCWIASYWIKSHSIELWWIKSYSIKSYSIESYWIQL